MFCNQNKRCFIVRDSNSQQPERRVRLVRKADISRLLTVLLHVYTQSRFGVWSINTNVRPQIACSFFWRDAGPEIAQEVCTSWKRQQVQKTKRCCRNVISLPILSQKLNLDEWENKQSVYWEQRIYFFRTAIISVEFKTIALFYVVNSYCTWIN